jgi:Protein of unknown function (DUF1018)
VNHIAAIHVVKKQLHLSEDDYRFHLQQSSGSTSCKAMNPVQLAKSRSYFDQMAARSGIKPSAAKPSGGAKKRLSGPLALLWSLWQQCADAKVVKDRRYTALEAFAKGMTGVAKLEWLSKPQQSLVIESLKAMQKRGPKHV